MNLLEKAIIIATKAHACQVDKGGNPYILHPLSVMQKVETVDEKIVAVLHDALEDTIVTSDYLRAEGFGEHIIEAIQSVTRRENESYKEFVLRAKENPIGRKVKLADMMENMDLSRIPNPTEEDYKRLKKYEKNMKLLTA